MNAVMLFRRVNRPALVGFRWSILAVVALTATLTALAQQITNRIEIQKPILMNMGGKVDFPVTLLPKIPGNLPLIKLTAQAPPEAFLTDTLVKSGIQRTEIQPLQRVPMMAQRGISEHVMGVMQGERVRALWHRQTGEAEIFPQMEVLKPERFEPQNNRHLIQARSLASQVFARTEILPKDATQFTLEEARPLLGTTAQRGGGKGVAPAERLHYLSYVAAQRQVRGYQVHGPGSRALLAIDNTGAVQSFLLRWKSGSESGAARETRTPQQIHSALMAAVDPLTKMGEVHVMGVEIAYYDDWEATVMGPVYRITARVHPTHPAEGNNLTLNDSFVILYSQYGDAPLSPTLIPNLRDLPQNALETTNSGNEEMAKAVPPGDPTVGRYIIQHAEGGWLSNAQGFWSGLTSTGSGAFTNSQYLWAIPAQYTSNANARVNSVQVALTEGHGNWWLFATDDHGAVVNIDSIPDSGGYGTANHGQLNYWILHGCEIVPSAADAPCPPGSRYPDSRNWYDTWFRMFKGMHTVVGYRTVMWIDDGAGYPFGRNLALGVPVISAWFNVLMSLSGYHGNPTYEARCGNSPPMGRPSAVTVCGHADDNIYQQGSIPPPSCLTNFWIPD